MIEAKELEKQATAKSGASPSSAAGVNETPDGDSISIYTHADGSDRRWQNCRCSVCGTIQQCTPDNDFYGDDGEPLICESCFKEQLASDGITVWFTGTVL